MSIWLFIIFSAALVSIIVEGFKAVSVPKSRFIRAILYALVALIPSFMAGMVVGCIYPMEGAPRWAYWIGLAAIIYVIQYIAGISIIKLLGELIEKKIKSL